MRGPISLPTKYSVLAAMLPSVSPVINGAELASPQPSRPSSSIRRSNKVEAWVTVSPAILIGLPIGTSSGKSCAQVINMKFRQSAKPGDRMISLTTPHQAVLPRRFAVRGGCIGHIGLIAYGQALSSGRRVLSLAGAPYPCRGSFLIDALLKPLVRADFRPFTIQQPHAPTVSGPCAGDFFNAGAARLPSLPEIRLRSLRHSPRFARCPCAGMARAAPAPATARSTMPAHR